MPWVFTSQCNVPGMSRRVYVCTLYSAQVCSLYSVHSTSKVYTVSSRVYTVQYALVKYTRRVLAHTLNILIHQLISLIDNGVGGTGGHVGSSHD